MTSIRGLLGGGDIGNPGTGKTHLACELAFTACARGRKVRFYTVYGLETSN